MRPNSSLQVTKAGGWSPGYFALEPTSSNAGYSARRTSGQLSFLTWQHGAAGRPVGPRSLLCSGPVGREKGIREGSKLGERFLREGLGPDLTRVKGNGREGGLCVCVVSVSTPSDTSTVLIPNIQGPGRCRFVFTGRKSLIWTHIINPNPSLSPPPKPGSCVTISK